LYVFLYAIFILSANMLVQVRNSFKERKTALKTWIYLNIITRPG